jgi:hypothetical protein
MTTGRGSHLLMPVHYGALRRRLMQEPSTRTAPLALNRLVASCLFHPNLQLIALSIHR